MIKNTFSDFLGEGKKVTLKRQYTENHPAITVGKSADIRNRMLEAIKDGKITQEQFNTILSEMSNDSSRWLKRNSRFFNVSEDGVTLSKYGVKILNTITVNEGNAFGDAVRKAKEAGEKEFEFEGKTYKVTENSEVSERNAFLGARAKAIEEDREEFEFNGKTYKVTTKSNVSEGNAFGDAVRKAKEAGDEEFEFDGKTYKVEEDHTDNPNDKYVVKPCDEEGTPWAVWEGDVRVECFETEEEAEAYAKKQNMEQGLENININMKNTTFLHESFSDFLAANYINEALGSSILSSILSFGQEDPKAAAKKRGELANGFYSLAKVALDKVQDEDFILSSNPTDVYKNVKGASNIVFWISDNPKENPYGDVNAGSWNKQIPGGGSLLAVTTGDRNLITNSWDRYAQSSTWKATDFKKSSGVGNIDNTNYRGWGATGLSNVKRISEVSDRAVIVNLELLRQKYSTTAIRDARAAAKAGATAFKSDKDFKTENRNRYEIILQNKASKLPLDKMVADAIDTLANHIKDGLAKGEKGRYGDIIIGKNKKGNEVKMRDASNHMSNILDNYARYVDYVKQEEESKEKYGAAESWYSRNIKQYAKEIKDGIDKIETFEYAW
jgi:hypothetical protein